MTVNSHSLLVSAADPTIIFHGSPSLVIEIPALLKGIGCVAIIAALFVFLQRHWHIHWLIAVVPILFVFAGVGLSILNVIFTEIVIDAERITCRQGVLNKRITSLELFRIQDVTSLHPWWQRLFNVGTVVVLTSDSNAPQWVLPGIVNAESMRQDLNRAAIALRDQKGIREFNMGRL